MASSASLKEIIETLKSKNRESEEKILGKNDRIRKLEGKRLELDIQLKDLRNSEKKLTGKGGSPGKSTEELKFLEFEELARKLADAEEILGNKEIENSTLVSYNSTLKGENSKKVGLVKELEEQLDFLVGESKAGKLVLAKKESKINILEAKYEILLTDFETLKSEKSKLESASLELEVIAEAMSEKEKSPSRDEILARKVGEIESFWKSKDAESEILRDLSDA